MEMLILQIIGGIVVFIIVAMVLGYLYFRLKFGKYLHAQPESQPLKIHLVEDVQPTWLEKSKPKKILAQVTSLGFEQGKSFTIQEMEGISLVHLFKDNIHSVVCFHEIAGAWLDFAIKTTDGKEYFVSNVPLGEKIDVPPSMIKYVNKTDTVEQLYERMLDIVEKVNVQNVPAEQFREFFEASYKKEMSWRVRKGGVSYEEFVAEAESFKKNNFTEKQLKEGFTEHKLHELYDWHYPAIEEYMDKLGGDVKDIEDLTYECFIVPFKTHMPSFIEYLEQQDFITDEQCDKLKIKFASDTDVFSVFEQINNLFSKEMQAKFLIEQDFPLPLKIYSKPNANIHAISHRFHHTHRDIK